MEKDLRRVHSSDGGGEGKGSPITSLPYSTIKERYEIGEIEAIRRTHTEPSFLNLAKREEVKRSAVDPIKIKAIMEMPPPKNLRELKGSKPCIYPTISFSYIFTMPVLV